MPIVEVQLPTGEIVEVDAPEGTTDEQVFAFVSQQEGLTAPAGEEATTPETGQEDFIPTVDALPDAEVEPLVETEEPSFLARAARAALNPLDTVADFVSPDTGEDLATTLERDIKRTVSPFIGEEENGKSKLENTLFGMLKTISAPQESVSQTLAHQIYEGGNTIITPAMVLNGEAEKVTKYKGISDAIFENEIDTPDSTLSPGVKAALGTAVFVIDTIVTDPINIATAGGAAVANHMAKANQGVQRIVDGLAPLKSRMAAEELLEEAGEKVARGTDKDTVMDELAENAVELAASPKQVKLIEEQRAGEVFDQTFSKQFNVEQLNRIAARGAKPQAQAAIVGDMPAKHVGRANARKVVEDQLLKGRSPKMTKEVHETAKQLSADGMSPAAALARSVDQVVAKRIPSPKAKEAPVTAEFTKAQRLTRAVRGAGKQVSATTRYFAQPAIDRITAINPLLGQNVRRLTFGIMRKTTDDVRAVERLYKKIPERHVMKFDQAGRNGDVATQTSIARQFGAEEDLTFIRKRLDEEAARRAEYDKNFEKLEGFMPRLVRDLKGLRDDLGMSEGEFAVLQRALARKNGHGMLDGAESSELIDSLVKGRPMFQGRNRTIHAVPDNLAVRYESGKNALMGFFHRTNETNAIRDFTGGLAGKANHEMPKDLTGTLGEGIEKFRAAGMLTAKDGDDLTGELINLLHGVLYKGRVPGHEGVRRAKQLVHVATIGFNPGSTLAQLADAGVAASRFGLRNVVKNIFKKGGSDEVYDQGLRALSHDLRDAKGIEKLERLSLRASLFDKADKLFGAASSRAASQHLASMAKKNPGKFITRVRDSYTPDEAKQLLREFRGEAPVTDLSRAHTFAEVAEFRPLGREDMPQAWLDHPNGRALYTLLSWTMKQTNLAKKDIMKALATPGKRVEGVKALALMTMFMAAANVPRASFTDWLAGREFAPDSALAHGAFAYGMMGKQLFEGVKRGNAVEAIMPAIGVAVGTVGKAISTINKGAQGDVEGAVKDFTNISALSRTARYVTERVVDGDLADAGMAVANTAASGVAGVAETVRSMIPEGVATQKQAEEIETRVDEELKPLKQSKFEAGLKAVENAPRVGRDPATGKWAAHESIEGGNPTVGYGHKLTDAEVKSGKFDKGITDEQVNTLFKMDLAKARGRVSKKVKGFDKLETKYQDVITNIEFNAGFNPKEWPKLMKAIKAKDDATVRKEMVTVVKDRKGNVVQRLTERATQIADAVGLD